MARIKSGNDFCLSDLATFDTMVFAVSILITPQSKMIQVDVFWSYAFGASFAAAAGAVGLKDENNFFSNRFYAYAVTFLGVIFAPSGAYLLAAFPGWESMQVLSDSSRVDAWLPMLFASSNVLLGVLGFRNAFACIQRGDELAAHTHWIVAYMAFAAILGFGYARFLHAGTSDQFNAGEDIAYLDWFQGRVFFTLLAMAVVLLPAYFVPMVAWLKASLNTRARRDAVRKHILSRVSRLWLLISLVYVAVVPLLDLLAGTSLRTYLADGWASWFAPLIGFTAATLIVFGTATIPFTIVHFASRSASGSSASPAHGRSPARGRSPSRKQK
jgi:hypothetical protein